MTSGGRASSVHKSIICLQGDRARTSIDTPPVRKHLLGLSYMTSDGKASSAQEHMSHPTVGVALCGPKVSDQLRSTR